MRQRTRKTSSTDGRRVSPTQRRYLALMTQGYVLQGDTLSRGDGSRVRVPSRTLRALAERGLIRPQPQAWLITRQGVEALQ